MTDHQIDRSHYIEFGKTILTQLGVQDGYARAQMEGLLDADQKESRHMGFTG